MDAKIIINESKELRMDVELFMGFILKWFLFICRRIQFIYSYTHTKHNQKYTRWLKHFTQNAMHDQVDLCDFI